MPLEAREKMLTRFIPDFEDVSDIIPRKRDSSQISLWKIRFSQAMPGRKLFRTGENRSLGTGPRSLESGDIVCILAGGSVPYIIRPVGDVKDNKFRFIGEAYVHTIMHGEAVRTRGRTLREIILV